MREINVAKVQEAVEAMCMEANLALTEDVQDAMKNALESETNSLAKEVLEDLIKNERVASELEVPICQDTGMAVVFVDLGQEVALKGGSLEEAIHEGVRRGYEKGYLRKSVVKSPITRVNTKDNTPAVIHYRVVEGNQIRLRFAPKGFGSENMGRLGMLKPSDGRQGVLEFIVDTVKMAGPNACPPLVIGVGVGGTMEKACLIAKEQLLRNIGEPAVEEEARGLEEDLMKRIEALDIGPQGFGGKTTALAVHAALFPTHIAGLPVCVNINCHVARHRERVI
ncbi:fumarate hydratase [Gottschalkiaceae bacterium SANA]|nr:fumarate hydratase [Gottschalkiaceae bacterium SANA]